MFRCTPKISLPAAAAAAMMTISDISETLKKFGPSGLERVSAEHWSPAAAAAATAQDKKPPVFSKHHLDVITKLPLQPEKGTKRAADVPPQATQHKGKKTLVLDLDETVYDPSWVLRATEAERKKGCRPYHREFLDKATELFEVIVWTRSGGQWPAVKCEALGLKPVHTLQGWGDCDRGGRKAMWKIDRQPDQIFLIDDDQCHLPANPRSQILIPGWSSSRAGEDDDKELLHLIPMLEAIAKAKTVQEVLDPYMARVLAVSEKAKMKAAAEEAAQKKKEAVTDIKVTEI